MFPTGSTRRRLDAIDRSGFEPAAPLPSSAPRPGRPSIDEILRGLDFEPAEASFDPVATGMRVLPGVAGSFFGPVGGAVGSGAGELAAQLWEGKSLNPFADDGLNLTQIGVQAGLGAIPGGKAFQELKGFGGLLARGGVNAATGAAIGGVTAPVIAEVEREGLEGLNVFDLEDGALEKMAQGAKWGAGFGAGGSLAMDGLGAYIASRAGRRSASIDTAYDPNFESRYKPPQQTVARPQRQAQPVNAIGRMTAPPAGYQFDAYGVLQPDGSMPVPGEVPPVMPAPFTAPPPRPAPVPDMPLMQRPRRAYDDGEDLFADLAPNNPPDLSPQLSPELVSELESLGVNPDVIRTLSPEDADEVLANFRPPTFDPETQALYEQAFAQRAAIEPDVDPRAFQDEFNFSLERFRDMNAVRSEGLDPQELMRAIAERGGLNEADDFAGDQWNRQRRPNAELQRIKELAAGAGYTDGGAFGTSLGVRGVFRKGGRTIDGMVADLRSDPRFGTVENPNDLLALLEQAFIIDRQSGPMRRTPRLEDLALPKSMEALQRRRGAGVVDEPNPLDDILEILTREEAEGGPFENPNEALRRAGFEVDAPVAAAAEARPAATLVDELASPRPAVQGETYTPEAQRAMMMDLAKDPQAVAGGREMMRRRGEIDANRIPEPDSLQRRRAGDVLDELETAPPTAKFAGMQDDGLGGEIPLFNIEGGPRDRSTVSAETLKTLGIDAPPVPRTPADVVLPGTEDVRAIENATPEVADVPFSLEADTRGVKVERAARGAREADSQSALDDLFANPERGAIRPGALGAVAGGAVGATGGAATIDEDDSFLEKAGKIAAGAAVGAGVGGKIGGGAVQSRPSIAARSTSTRSAGTPAPAADSTITPSRGRPVTLPKYASNINLERIDTTDGVKATINEIANTLRPQLENARRGRIAQDVTRQMAAELGMTEAELLSRRRGQAFNAEQALAAREINAASARRLTDAAAAVRTSPTPENYSRLMLSLQQQVAIQEQIAGATAEAGRSLAQFRMMAQDTLSLPELNELILASGGTETMDDVARRIMAIDPTNLRAMNQFVREAKKATVGDKVYEAWMNALLSGPVTHVANTVSNGLTALTHPTEKTITGLLDLLRAKASGTPQERFAREGAYAVVGLWKGLSGGVRAGLQAALTDTPQFGIGRQETTPGGKIGGKVGQAVRIPTKALLFEDEFFKNIVYSADLHARAVRTALREGAKGKAIGERVAEMLQNPSLELQKSGQKEALYRTFNTPLTARWEKSLMELRSAVPGARWIMPFLRTPINVAKFGLERTPLHLADVIAKVAGGKLSLQDLEEESAKIAIGATLAFGVASAFQNGMITGGGSPDRSTHATQAAKRPDYSVRVGDQWYSYQRLEPAGISLGLTADFMETLETGKQDVTQLPAKLLYSFSRNLQSKTFLQGLTDFFNVLSDYPRYGDEWINRMGGSLVPTAVAQVARARDPIVRKPRSVGEAIMNRTGQGESLTPMIDVFGKPVTSDMGFTERMMSPIQRRKANDDPLLDELERLGVTLSVPSERLTVKDKELSTNDKSTLAQARGQAVKRELDDLLESQSFTRADDDTKRERVERAINQARDAVSRRARTLVRRDEPLSIEELLGIKSAPQ